MDDRETDGGANFILRIKEQETRLTLQEHDDIEYQNKHYNTNQRDEGTWDDQGTDGGTNFILRIKEQETRLTLQEHDNDDDGGGGGGFGGGDDDDDDDDEPNNTEQEPATLFIIS